MKKSVYSKIIPYSIAAVAIILDRILKVVVMDYFCYVPNNSPDYLSVHGYSSHSVIPNVFSITCSGNDGAAWGIMSGNQWFLIGVTAIALIAVAWCIWSDKILKNSFTKIAAALILGGGVGNLIDRVFNGKLFAGEVIDYLQTDFINFPIFNFADCCVVVGTIAVAVYILFFDKTHVQTNGVEEK